MAFGPDQQRNSNETHGLPEPGNFEGVELSNVRPVLMIFDQSRLHEWRMLVQKRTTIGREEGIDIILNDETISRCHSYIEFENIDHPVERPICVLVDNGSRNGTYLNGKKVTEPTILQNGDRIFIGSTCLAFFIRTELEISSDQTLRTLATTDSLTGLINRGFMAIQFQKEFDRSQRYHRPLSVLMIDVDDFKKINDTYGHPVGDEVLRLLAATLTSKCRIHDITARYGGEEFAMLLPETGIQGAMVIAERLRKTICAQDYQTSGPLLHVTASIGVAELEVGSDKDFEGLISRADEVLYQAKHSGKNKVCADGISQFDQQ